MKMREEVGSVETTEEGTLGYLDCRACPPVAVEHADVQVGNGDPVDPQQPPLRHRRLILVVAGLAGVDHLRVADFAGERSLRIIKKTTCAISRITFVNLLLPELRKFFIGATVDWKGKLIQQNL